MKTWTVVIEFKDDGVSDTGTPDKFFTKRDLEEIISEGFSNFPSGLSFQIFECTEAPYGPQGVTLIETGRNTTILGRAGRVQTASKEGK